MEKFIFIKKIHPIGICSMDTNIVDQKIDYEAYLDILSNVCMIIHDSENDCWIDDSIAIPKLKEIYGNDIDIQSEEPDLIPEWAGIKLPYINSNFN